MTAKECLQKELTTLERSLLKSRQLYVAGIITAKLHAKHTRNLVPQIEDFKNAINKLS